MTLCAHQQLVQQDIDWCRVEDGLSKYPRIGNYFCLKELKSNAPSPYFCHWLSWRMSRWMRSGRDHCYLALLDSLLDKAENLAGWDAHRLRNPSYESYWSILWELQVADALDRHPQIDDVEWLANGPDLRACVDGTECYVECYVYMKSYAALTYIKELLWSLSPHFVVWHRISVPMGLPTGGCLVTFLHSLFQPYVDNDKFLAALKDKAQREGTANMCQVRKGWSLSWSENHERADVFFPDGAGNLRIHLTDPNTLAQPDLDNAHGAGPSFGEGFVVDAIQKAIQNKKDRNALESHHPNVLLVNCLLPVDYVADLDQTLAFYNGRLPDYALKEAQDALDAACFFAHGVDHRLCLSNGQPLYGDQAEHPLACILSRPASGNDQ